MATRRDTTRSTTTTDTGRHKLAWTPLRTWLAVLGFGLVGLAILGLFTSLHGLGMHIEGGEDVVHWVLAALTLGLVFGVRDEERLSMLALVYGSTYLVVGVLGFFVERIGAWHVGTMDNVLHLALGVITTGVAWAARRPAGTGRTLRA